MRGVDAELPGRDPAKPAASILKDSPIALGRHFRSLQQGFGFFLTHIHFSIFNLNCRLLEKGQLRAISPLTCDIEKMHDSKGDCAVRVSPGPLVMYTELPPRPPLAAVAELLIHPEYAPCLEVAPCLWASGLGAVSP